MGRRVITAKDVSTFTTMGAQRAAGAQPGLDDYASKLLKYIPAEIVAGFVAIDGIIKSVTDVPAAVGWIVFLVLLVLTPFYIWRVTTEADKSLAVAQIAVSTIAFFVWVFAVGGPFSSLGWYMPLYGAVLLVLYTLTVPVFVGK